MRAGTAPGKRAMWWVVAQIPLLAASIAVPVAQVLLQVQGPWVSELELPARAVGLVLVGLAVLVFRAAKRQLGPDLVATPMPASEATLRVTGVYARVRHPIYAALMLGVVGWGLVWVSVAGVVLGVACAVFFLVKSRYEEVLLEHAFPDYEEYRRQVPGFVPRVR